MFPLILDLTRIMRMGKPPLFNVCMIYSRPTRGEVKMWHRFLAAAVPSDDRRREVKHCLAEAETAESETAAGDQDFAEHLLCLGKKTSNGF